MIAPPVQWPQVRAGQAGIRAAGRRPGVRLRGARQDQAAGRLAVGLDAQDQKVDRLAHRLRVEPQQRLGGPVGVAVIDPRGGAVGLPRRQPGEAAVLVAADAGEGRVGALLGHAAQLRIGRRQHVAPGDVGVGLPHDLGDRKGEAPLGLAPIRPDRDHQIVLPRLDHDHAPRQHGRASDAVADHRRPIRRRLVPLGAAAGRMQAGEARAPDRQRRRGLGDEQPSRWRGQPVGRVDIGPGQTDESNARQPPGAPERQIDVAVRPRLALKPRGHDRHEDRPARFDQAVGAREERGRIAAFRRCIPLAWSSIVVSWTEA